MDKTNPPRTFGVFKPVGHTLIAFKTDADLQMAVKLLTEAGFADSTFVQYTPAEMKIQVDSELQTASPLAGFGYELDLVKVHGTLAESGCSFLVVHAPEEAQAERVATVAQATNAVTAQHYGTFMIEDVITPAPGSAAAP